MTVSIKPAAAFFVGFFVTKAVSAGLMCVQCDSAQERNPGSCLKRPPLPVSCFGSDSRQMCMRVFEYNINGSLVRFVRDCTSLPTGDCTISKPEEIAAGASYKICHDVCDTDGCNGSARVALNVLNIFIPLVAATAVACNQQWR